MRRSVVLILALSLTPPLAAAQDASGPLLALGGDVLYDAPLAYQIRHRADEVGSEEAWREVFADLAPSMRDADLTVVNLEVPISPRYRERVSAQDLPVFRAPEEFLDALCAAGVDAFTVANNHAYDQSTRGLRDTIRAAQQRRVPLIGHGDDAASAASARVLRVGRARIAIAAWTEGTNYRPPAEEGSRPCIAFLRDGTVRDTIVRARAESDLVVAVFHWVREDLTRPRPVMRETAREAAEAGADLVIGHGTHVPGSTEIIATSDGRRVRVLYSLGNLLAAMEEPMGTLASEEVGVRDAPLAMVSTRWSGRRLEVAGVEVRHHWIARPVGRAPWMSGGSLAVSRPVAIERELQRIERTQCGSECDHRASAYRRRVVLVNGAMADLAEPLPPREPLLVASAEAHPVEVERLEAEEDAALRVDARERSAPLDRALDGPATREPRDAGDPSMPRSTPPRPVIADSDPRLAPYLRGIVFPMEFHDGRVAERSVDPAALSRVIALMTEDRGLRCEIIGYTTVAEADRSATLGAMRARRLKGLIAGRGPSRSRFATRGGRLGQSAQAGLSHVVLRLHRAGP